MKINMCMEIHETVQRLLPIWSRSLAPWWQKQAVDSIENGWFTPITGRTDNDLYMLRMWLVEPKRKDDGKLASENSVLLHWIVRPDDDGAMHDHPWNFTTTILEGGYEEHQPSHDWTRWNASYGIPGHATMAGPQVPGWITPRYPGDTVHHHAEDLHCVGRLLPTPSAHAGGGCWTLVRTGHEVREWGFHAPDKPWMPWRTYLECRKAASP